MSKSPEQALRIIEPLRGTKFYGLAAGQVLSAFHDGGPKRARAKAMNILDAYDTGVGVTL